MLTHNIIMTEDKVDTENSSKLSQLVGSGNEHAA